MGLERGAFAFGVAGFPLTESLDNSLLDDADPALAQFLAFLAATIETYCGGRLVAQAETVGLRLRGAVVGTAAVDPAPFLLQDQFQFPLLCLYRRRDVFSGNTVAYDKSAATWEFSYVLPSMNATQVAAIHPILRSVATIIRRSLTMGWDPSYLDGENINATTGVTRAKLMDVSYGGYPRIEQVGEIYRAVTGTIEVHERERPVLSEFDDFDGADASIGITDDGGTGVEHVADVETHAPPTLASISPDNGSAAGGDLVTLTVTGARMNTRPIVIFDGAAADAVTVVSATTITCRTPPHAAFTTFVADVTLIAADGQSDTLEEAFTFNA